LGAGANPEIVDNEGCTGYGYLDEKGLFIYNKITGKKNVIDLCKEEGLMSNGNMEEKPKGGWFFK
jgi:hypothetical protein